MTALSATLEKNAIADAVNNQSEHQQRLKSKLTRELGGAINEALRDETTEDILLNPDGSLWSKRLGQSFTRIGTMPSALAMAALSTIAAFRKTVINHSNPLMETELPGDDSRFEGIIPPVTRAPVFAIRLRPKKIYTIADYVSSGILSSKDDPLNVHRNQTDFIEHVKGMDHAGILAAAITERKNILLVGSTGSGKTTFANSILAELARLCPSDRVVLIEDTVELQCEVPNVVALRSGGSIEMIDCLRAAMRLKPNRIIVGEVRGKEALTLLKAWNTGHPGGIATAHADDAYAGLLRLEHLVAEATNAPQQHLIAETVDLVVFIAEEPALPARRKVKQLAYVTGYRDGRYQLEYL